MKMKNHSVPEMHSLRNFYVVPFRINPNEIFFHSKQKLEVNYRPPHDIGNVILMQISVMYILLNKISLIRMKTRTQKAASNICIGT